MHPNVSDELVLPIQHKQHVLDALLDISNGIAEFTFIEMFMFSFIVVFLSSDDFPHCILVAFGGENDGEYARSLKRFAFIAIQHLRWLWTFLGISNSGITVFSSDLLETVVTTTKSQNIK